MGRYPKADTRELARLVFVRDGGRCFYCHQDVSLEARPWLSEDQDYARVLRAATFDHIVPRARGGLDSVDNGVCACVSCNEERGDAPASFFLYRKMLARGAIAAAA